jgi:hypothetical protein
MLPWDTRPPIPVRLGSEQLDAFFSYGGRYFIVEAKAKKNIITEGSPDWEDFELKVVRRKGRVCGLFLSIFPVAAIIIARSMELSREGSPTIVVAGTTWELLSRHSIPMSAIIEYYILKASILLDRNPPDPADIAKWFFDSESSQALLTQHMTGLSSLFLRRHKSPYHEQYYVTRSLDNRILEHVAPLRPTLLSRHTTHYYPVTLNVAMTRFCSPPNPEYFLSNEFFFGINPAQAKQPLPRIWPSVAALSSR